MNPLLASPKGYVYVGDEDTSRIYKFDPKGRFLSHFQFSADAADSSHENLHALAIDHQDRLWVGGWSSTNLFAADGRFLRQLKGLNTSALAIGEGDRIYSAERSGVAEYAAGAGPGSSSAPEAPEGRAPRDPWAGITKDQLLPSHPLRFPAPAGSTRTGPVTAVAVDAKGFVYTAYPESLRVLLFSPSGERERPIEIRAPSRGSPPTARSRSSSATRSQRLLRHRPLPDPAGLCRHVSRRRRRGRSLRGRRHAGAEISAWAAVSIDREADSALETVTLSWRR